MFDPATGTWSAGPSTLFAHGNVPQAVELADGRILLTGGRYGAVDVRTSAEIFDPATNAWTATGSMQRGRAGHTLTRLADGRILAAGGWTSGGFDNTAEIYNPATGTWAFTASMSKAKWFHTATLLNDGSGRVLVAGGENYNEPAGPHFRVTEYFDPASGTWTAGPLLGTGRADHEAALLPDGRVIVIGGIHGFAVDAALASTEILDGLSWQPGPSMAEGGSISLSPRWATARCSSAGGTTSNQNPQTVTAGDRTIRPRHQHLDVRRHHELAAALSLCHRACRRSRPRRWRSEWIGQSHVERDRDRCRPGRAHDNGNRSPVANGNGWNNSNVAVTLEATDNPFGTGVQSIQYSCPAATTSSPARALS